jgi:hypothetical protein
MAFYFNTKFDKEPSKKQIKLVNYFYTVIIVFQKNRIINFKSSKFFSKIIFFKKEI